MLLVVRPLSPDAPPAGDVEVVERKGRGHPDTVADALAEHFGENLCRAYAERFGRVLHFNVDKALVRGGASRPAWGGGEVVEPIEVLLAGRATAEAGGVRVPVEEIAVEGTRSWLRAHFRHLDPDRHVRVRCLVRPGSADLAALHASVGALANDTSIGVGYAPHSPLERAVLDADAALDDARASNPAFGEDTKVMGVRVGRRVELTLACAMVDRHLDGPDAYRAAVATAAARVTERTRADLVEVNTADDVAAGRVYLTVTGTSAEAGDDGQVGRGNRVNGLITPYRPMSLEAAAGKNPITHVGKLYNLAARDIAAALVAEVAGVRGAVCVLVSRIGRPVRDPWLVEVRLAADAPVADAVVEGVVRAHLDRIDGSWQRLYAAEGRR